MIEGREDTYFTLDEFGAMVGRKPATIRRWAREGRLRLRYLCGVPLVEMSQIERLILGEPPREGGELAKKCIGKKKRKSRRATGKPMTSSEILAVGKRREQ